MRSLFVISLLLCCVTCFAQRQNVLFFDKNGYPVAEKDSADYIQVITEPDSGAVLFNVAEYYKSGKPRFVGKSTEFVAVRLEGIGISYFENGRRMAIVNYKKNAPVGDKYEYFPNGKIYLHREYYDVKPSVTSPDYIIKAVYDSLGTITAKNGTGYISIYNNDFTEIIEAGQIKNGLTEGVWKGTYKDKNIAFEEKYNKGKLLSGTAVRDGRIATYTSREVQPRFPDGKLEFSRFISRAIHYPQIARERKIEGRVVLTFTVEEDGTLTNIKVVRSLNPDFDNEAVNAIKNSPVWIPGTQFGFPVRTTFGLPVNFSLN